jgi:hypothetical protein
VNPKSSLEGWAEVSGFGDDAKETDDGVSAAQEAFPVEHNKTECVGL